MRLIAAIKAKAKAEGKTPSSICRRLVQTSNNNYLFDRLVSGTTSVNQFEKLQMALWGKVE